MSNAPGERDFGVVAEVDADGQGGCVSNYASPGQVGVLMERHRKLGAQALGEAGPNAQLTPDEARITSDRNPLERR